MATVAHTIYSRHDPQQSTVENESTFDNTDTLETDPWLTERATFGLSVRAARPPKFVRAEVDYDPWLSQGTAGPSHIAKGLGKVGEEEKEGGVSSWYRSLVSSTKVKEKGKQREDVLKEETRVRPSSTPPAPESTTLTRPTSSTPSTSRTVPSSPWFISRALSSQTPSSSSSSTPAPTIADILSLNPPSLNPSQKLVPPIFLSIGPGNKGFEMLAKSGWEEGEGLGGARLQCGTSGGSGGRRKTNESGPSSLDWTQDMKVKTETIEVAVSIPSGSGHDIEDDEVQEIRKVDLVDLTSDVEDPNDAEDDSEYEDSVDYDRESPALDHNPVSLLTPLPTVLKSDRLGIGLKRKRLNSSSHQRSRELTKRVTHTSTALAAHSQNAEQMRRQARMIDGRGHRGFQKAHNREAEKRKAVLQYLNG